MHMILARAWIMLAYQCIEYDTQCLPCIFSLSCLLFFFAILVEKYVHSACDRV